jgi:hypothetical protein
MGLPVRTGEMTVVDIPGVVAHVEGAGQFPLGEGRDIGPDEVRAILEMAA